MTSAGPLLVYGERSLGYDFGPGHPLTPRRFGPGIDLLRAVGAEPGLAPEPAPDEDLLACHSSDYLRTVRAFSADPDLPRAAGIGSGDNPPFRGMHEAGAAVAGGSLRAMEAILRGDIEHACHPGGGLHHAMRDRASGFCIYDDPALAIARARRDGRRVLYIDLDVHHGDGVQALHLHDPGVLTVSIHESGGYLFPGTGAAGELGEGSAAGTVVNAPLEPYTGETAWLSAVRTLVPQLAAAFGPDVIVSQHGADSHALDPLAHLRVTTTAMGEAARLVDRMAHLHAGGRWLATGGGGYDVYRVVPRAWALTWLAGAHRDPPERIPAAWRERWADEAARYGQGPLPEHFEDAPNAGMEISAAQVDAERRSRGIAGVVRRVVVPRLVREAVDRGWWSPLAEASADARGGGAAGASPGAGRAHPRDAAVSIEHEPAVIASLDAATLERLALAPRVVAPLDPAAAKAILVAALRDGPGVKVSAALDGTRIVGLVVSASSPGVPGRRDLLAIGVAPGARRRGLATRLLEAHVATLRPGDERLHVEITVGERDPVDPLPVAIRRGVARRLLSSAGWAEVPVAPELRAVDPFALASARTI